LGENVGLPSTSDEPSLVLPGWSHPLHITLGIVRTHTLVLDIEGPLSSSRQLLAAHLILAAKQARTLRTMGYSLVPIHRHYLLSGQALPPTLVLAVDCLPATDSPISWNDSIYLFSDVIPGGPTRVVLNVSYAWSTQLFNARFAWYTFFPPSVQELVIHLRKIDIERPRYVRCKGGKRGGMVLEGYHAASPIPILGENEYLERFDSPPLYRPKVDLFTSIAQLMADSLSREEQTKHTAQSNSIPPKLTLVGLDDFDAACEADVEGHKVFEDMVDQLPWNGPPPPPTTDKYAPSAPIASSFVELVVGLVEPSQRAQVEKNVRVVSSAEYRAHLSDEQRLDEEWWT
jgi:hypothetical protein